MKRKATSIIAGALITGLMASGMAMANEGHAKGHGKGHKAHKGHHKGDKNKCKGGDGCGAKKEAHEDKAAEKTEKAAE